MMPRFLITLLAICVTFSTTPIYANGMVDLWNAMADLEDLLDNKEIGITPRRLGTRIHSAVAGVWDNMATACERLNAKTPNSKQYGVRVLKEEGQRKRQTFLGKHGEHVFGIDEIESRPYVTWDGDKPKVQYGRGPRLEVWIEKEIGEGTMRVDRVIIDHEAKTITVSDLTALDPNDRDVANDPALKKHALEHEGKKSTRAEMIEAELKAYGVKGYTVHVDIGSGQYYKTALKNRRRVEDAEFERRRKNLSQTQRLDDPGAGGKATGVITTIAVGYFINMLFPRESEAAQHAQTQAEEKFHAVIQSYAVGDVDTGDRIRRELAEVDYDELTAIASSFFPMIDPQMSVALYQRFMDPALNELRSSAIGIAEARQAYRKALESISIDLRAPEERLRAHVEQVRQEVQLLYTRLDRRIQYWSDQLTSLAGQRATQFWPAAQTQELQAFLRGPRSDVEQRLTSQKDWAMDRLTYAEPKQVLALMADVQADLALAYAAYWKDILGPSIIWLQEGQRASQREKKALLRAAYEREAKALKDSSAASKAWEQLRERFAEKERDLDTAYRRWLQEMYMEWANETRKLAERVRKLAPSLPKFADSMDNLDDPGSTVCQIERRLYADLDVLTYAGVYDLWRHYTPDPALLTVTARPALEAALMRIVEEQDAIVLLGLWINEKQRPLQVLDAGLQEGDQVTLWAETAKPPYQVNDTPVGPPPVGGIRSRDIVWTLDGVGLSTETGHVVRFKVPATPAAFPYTQTLRLMRPGVKSLVMRIIIQPKDMLDAETRDAVHGGLDDLIAPAAPVGESGLAEKPEPRQSDPHQDY